MKTRVAFVDNQLMALEFNSGDIVQRGGLHDFFLTPYIGRVIVSNPSTGRVQVQWPWGVEEEAPAELVKVNPASIGHIPPMLADQSYSTWDKSQHVNDSDIQKEDEKWRKKLTASSSISIVSRAVRRYEKRTMPIWRAACQEWHDGKNEFETFQSLLPKFAGQFGPDAVRVTVANLYDLGRRLAIYWKDTNRTYKVTKRERASGKLTCPRCREYLKPRTYKKGSKLLQCKSCGFSIKPQDLMD
jgi:hypothetical protein